MQCSLTNQEELNLTHFNEFNAKKCMLSYYEKLFTFNYVVLQKSLITLLFIDLQFDIYTYHACSLFSQQLLLLSDFLATEFAEHRRRGFKVSEDENRPGHVTRWDQVTWKNRSTFNIGRRRRKWRYGLDRRNSSLASIANADKLGRCVRASLLDSMSSTSGFLVRGSFRQNMQL